MQDFPLTVQHIFAFGRRVHSGSKVLTYTGDSIEEATFAEVAERADRLAAALARLGVQPGDRVGLLEVVDRAHPQQLLDLLGRTVVLLDQEGLQAMT